MAYILAARASGKRGTKIGRDVENKKASIASKAT
jgi:hypothetical protein